MYVINDRFALYIQIAVSPSFLKCLRNKSANVGRGFLTRHRHCRNVRNTIFKLA